jgi:hypothetical protein
VTCEYIGDELKDETMGLTRCEVVFYGNTGHICVRHAEGMYEMTVREHLLAFAACISL